MQVFWFIPTHGDSRYLGTADTRAARFEPLAIWDDLTLARSPRPEL